MPRGNRLPPSKFKAFTMSEKSGRRGRDKKRASKGGESRLVSSQTYLKDISSPTNPQASLTSVPDTLQGRGRAGVEDHDVSIGISILFKGSDPQIHDPTRDSEDAAGQTAHGDEQAGIERESELSGELVSAMRPLN